MCSTNVALFEKFFDLWRGNWKVLSSDKVDASCDVACTPIETTKKRWAICHPRPKYCLKIITQTFQTTPRLLSPSIIVMSKHTTPHIPRISALFIHSSHLQRVVSSVAATSPTPRRRQFDLLLMVWYTGHGVTLKSSTPPNLKPEQNCYYRTQTSHSRKSWTNNNHASYSRAWIGSPFNIQSV